MLQGILNWLWSKRRTEALPFCLIIFSVHFAPGTHESVTRIHGSRDALCGVIWHESRCARGKHLHAPTLALAEFILPWETLLFNC